MAKIKLTKQEVLNLQQALISVGNLIGVKFVYAIARNQAKLKGEIEAIQAAYTAAKEFIEYENKRLEIVKRYAAKDEKGNDIIINDNGNQVYKITDEEAFNKEFLPLKEEHKVVLEARQKQVDEFSKLLKEEVEIDLYTVPFSNVPENINANQMSGILQIVEETK